MYIGTCKMSGKEKKSHQFSSFSHIVHIAFRKRIEESSKAETQWAFWRATSR